MIGRKLSLAAAALLFSAPLFDMNYRQIYLDGRTPKRCA